MTSRCTASILALGVLAIWLASVGPGGRREVFAGDARVAETLFKSGRQAFQKADYAGAEAFFRKALEENPGLIEACYWRGASLEKGGDKAGALACYREYLELFADRTRTGGTSREEQRLKGLAEKSVNALAAGEVELRKLEDRYVAALMSFARENFLRDPGISIAALDALIAVRPDHEEARRLREKLGGPSTAGEAPGAPAPKGAEDGPFGEVRSWKNLLAERTFRAESVQYSGALMVVDTRGGVVISPPEAIGVGPAFAYEAEFRVTEAYERGWLFGLAFAMRSGAFLCAFANSGRVVLLHSRSREAQDEAASFDMPPFDTEAWHRLGVIVRGPAVEAWFDGKKVLEWREPAGADLPGELGIFQQRCRTEHRVFRAGSLR